MQEDIKNINFNVGLIGPAWQNRQIYNWFIYCYGQLPEDSELIFFFIILILFYLLPTSCHQAPLILYRQSI